jgi:hypothetical protein
VDMKLEVLVTPVSGVDRAKAFYEKLGSRLDIDYVSFGFYNLPLFKHTQTAAVRRRRRRPRIATWTKSFM